MTKQSGARPRMSDELIVQANGVGICAQTFGAPSDPAMLLIHGATSPMHAWEDEFCLRLAAGRRFVIRYDQRDTGRSVSYPLGAPGYTLRDLVADAIGLLDVFDVPAAHLVGTSMGGGIAQFAAREYPARVLSLTLIGASPGGPDLPPMSEEFLAFVSSGRSPDWSDQEAVIEHIIEFLRICSGNSGHFDEATRRARLQLGLERTTNVASSQINHFAMDTGAPVRGQLGEIRVPTLVIHGERDPVFPLGHAHALVNAIPGAQLLVLEGTGHELPPAVWDAVIPAILELTAEHGRT